MDVSRRLMSAHQLNRKLPKMYFCATLKQIITVAARESLQAVSKVVAEVEMAYG